MRSGGRRPRSEEAMQVMYLLVAAAGIREGGEEARLIVERFVVLARIPHVDCVVVTRVEVALDRELRIVERLSQQAHRRIAQRREKLNLVEECSRNRGGAAFAGVLDGAEPEGFILDYRAADRTPKLLPVERKLFGVRIDIALIVIGKQAKPLPT